MMKKFLQTLLKTELPQAAQPDPAAYIETGSRLEFERSYFARRKCLSAAALLYLAGEKDCFLPACELADAIVSEPTWVHPAHGEKIDLFSAETGFLLAELSSVFPFGAARKERVRSAVLRHIAEPFSAQKFGWEEGGGNWLAVCAGNVAGALFYADGVEFSRQKERLKGDLLRYLDGFPDDGWCAEGLEYWNFGFGAFVRFSELLFPGLLSAPKARAAAAYPQKCFLCGNVTASFSDCPICGKADRGLVNFLAKEYDLPLLTAEETQIRAENCAYLPLSRGMRDGLSTAETRKREGGVFCGGTVSVFHKPHYSLAVKAGNNAEEHNHNDVGSFIVATGRGQLLADLGQPLYDRDYFSGKRYSNLAASSLGHSVPIVNGKGQRAGNFGGTLSADGRTVEFAGAYENCKKMTRRFTLSERAVTVSDEFSADDEIAERFVLLSDPQKDGMPVFSREGIAPRVTEASYFAHDGKKTPVYLADFPVPKGRTAASFTIPCKEI